MKVGNPEKKQSKESKLQKIVSKDKNFQFLVNGKIKCILTGHEMLPTLENFKAYLSSKSYKKGLQAQFDISQYKQFLVPHFQSNNFYFVNSLGLNYLPRNLLQKNTSMELDLNQDSKNIKKTILNKSINQINKKNHRQISKNLSSWLNPKHQKSHPQKNTMCPTSRSRLTNKRLLKNKRYPKKNKPSKRKKYQQRQKEKEKESDVRAFQDYDLIDIVIKF